MLKKLNFSIGVFDELSDNIKLKVNEESQKCKIYGVGVYTDRFIIDHLMTYPTNTLEERIKNVKALNGVDFVFPVDTSSPGKVKDIIENAYDEYLHQENS